jgi:hypothetical protein
MNLEATNNLLIAEKRDHLFSAESFYRDFASIESTRIQLENEIAHTKSELDALQFQFNDPHHNLFKKDLDQKRMKLNALKKEMQLLDIRWDEWEDLTEKQLYCMREELLNDIWALHPNQFELKKHQWNEFKTNLILSEEINKVQNLLQKLHHMLQTILMARSSVKGLGLWRYVLGISPNALIEKYLFAAHHYIESIEDELKKSINHSPSTPVQSLFQEIDGLLENLKKHCQSVWGFRHIDTLISNAEKNLTLQSASLQKYYAEHVSNAKELKNLLDEWLLEF